MSFTADFQRANATRKLANEVTNEVYVTLGLNDPSRNSPSCHCKLARSRGVAFYGLRRFLMEIAAPLATLKRMLLFPSHLLQLLNRFLPISELRKFVAPVLEETPIYPRGLG